MTNNDRASKDQGEAPLPNQLDLQKGAKGGLISKKVITISDIQEHFMTDQPRQSMIASQQPIPLTAPTRYATKPALTVPNASRRRPKEGGMSRPGWVSQTPNRGSNALRLTSKGTIPESPDLGQWDDSQTRALIELAEQIEEEGI